MTVTQAARYSRVGRQAILIAIHKGYLKSEKKKGQWIIHLADLQNYRENKYSRHKALFNGELLYNKAKGEWSIIEVAKYLGFTVAHTYYIVRQGYLPAFKKGAIWVIKEKDMIEYFQRKEKDQLRFGSLNMT